MKIVHLDKNCITFIFTATICKCRGHSTTVRSQQVDLKKKAQTVVKSLLLFFFREEECTNMKCNCLGERCCMKTTDYSQVKNASNKRKKSTVSGSSQLGLDRSQLKAVIAMVDGASLSGESLSPFSRRRDGLVTRTLEKATASSCGD